MSITKRATILAAVGVCSKSTICTSFLPMLLYAVTAYFVAYTTVVLVSDAGVRELMQDGVMLLPPLE